MHDRSRYTRTKRALCGFPFFALCFGRAASLMLIQLRMRHSPAPLVVHISAAPNSCLSAFCHKPQTRACGHFVTSPKLVPVGILSQAPNSCLRAFCHPHTQPSLPWPALGDRHRQLGHPQRSQWATLHKRTKSQRCVRGFRVRMSQESRTTIGGFNACGGFGKAIVGRCCPRRGKHADFAYVCIPPLTEREEGKEGEEGEEAQEGTVALVITLFSLPTNVSRVFQPTNLAWSGAHPYRSSVVHVRS